MPARTAPRGGRGWDGLIVVCAVAAYDGIRMSDWHLARHLSELAPVLYVDPPSFRHPAARGPRRAALRLRQEAPGLARLIPAAPPFPSRRAVAAATAALIRRDLRWATARLGGRVSAVLSGWPQFPVADACGERVHAYWAKDDFAAGHVDHLLTQPRTPHLAARCQAFAAQHTWARRATDIHHALTNPPPATAWPALMTTAPSPP